MGTRPTKVQAYFETAEVWAKQATCLKRQVGAVLVKGGFVIATAFNGAPAGWPHCTEVGCFIVDGKCVRTVHAEENAIYQAARAGHSTQGAMLYCTLQPCFKCTMALLSAGVTEFHWLEDHERFPNINQVRAGWPGNTSTI